VITPTVRRPRAFEFLTMVSFAIPGTVIGVSYIVAFNVAARADRRHGDPGDLLRIPQHAVGVRSGVAALAQIDKTSTRHRRRCAPRRCARCTR